MFKKSFLRVAAVGFCAALMCGCMALTACGGSTSTATDSSSTSSSEASKASYNLVADGTLTVATSPDYSPMEYQENGEIKGFDIALISEIADRLGLRVDVQNQSFDSLVSQVALGTKFDCSISSITINDERAEEVGFSDPYYDSNLAIVVNADSTFASKADLDGQPIAAQSGSSGEKWVKENLTNSEYTPFQEMPDALAALRTGFVSAVVYDEPVAENHVAGEYNDCKVLEVIPTSELYGIIVNKDNTGLTDAINDALKEITEDGTLDKLKKEYIS